MEFLPCISEILAIIVNMNCGQVIRSDQLTVLKWFFLLVNLLGDIKLHGFFVFKIPSK